MDGESILTKKAKMKFKYLLFLTIFAIIAVGALGCGKNLLTKNEYKKMPEEDIRKILLQHTPKGSSTDLVEGFIKNRLGKHFRVFDRALREDDKKYDWSIEEGDFTYKVYLARYGVLKNFLLGGYNVIALWVFNEDGFLKDVLVLRYFDGV